MGFLGDAWDVAKEVGTFAAEATEIAGEDTPLIGTGLNLMNASTDQRKSDEADMNGDHDKADYMHDRAQYDLLKAIPGVGSVLGVAELENGVVSGLRGKGFKNGMDDVGDSVMDWSTMLGINGKPPRRDDRDDDGMGGNNRHDTWGSHEDLRHRMEDKERMEDAQRRMAGGKEG